MPRPARRSPTRRFGGRLTIAFVVAALLMAGAVVTVNSVIDAKLSSLARVDVRTAHVSGGPENFLVVGSDTRAFTKNNPQLQQAFGNATTAGGQRSDTMMVIHVDPGRSQAVVVSFPRDLWVQIQGVGMAKINTALNAGPQIVIDTLRQDFGLPIHHFVQFDFLSFQDVVDAIGRVRVYVPYPARDNLTGLYEPVPGCASLDGASALAYVRSRELQYYSASRQQWLMADQLSDINRIARQQQFMRKLAGLAVKTSLSDPLTANTIINKAFRHLTVDAGLSRRDVLDLVDVFRTVNPNDTGHVQFGTLPWTEGPRQGGGQDVLYARQPDADALLGRLGGTVNPNRVAINGTAPGAAITPGHSQATTTTVPPASSNSTSGTPGAPATPVIADPAALGTPAPKTSLC